MPALPIRFVGIILEPDQRVLIAACADGTRLPGRVLHSRSIRRIVAQATAPEPVVKLAIAEMIRIVKKAVQVAEIADDFRELGAQDRGMSAPFFFDEAHSLFRIFW